jgi:hypothetical protein
MKTLNELTTSTGRPVDPHLMLGLVIPVHDGIQAQGDLIVLPLAEVAGDVKVHTNAFWREVPAEGIELLRGGTGGNAHTLVADPGTCVWTPDVNDTTALALGVLETLAVAYLLHREHGGTGIAPGNYVVRRQREQGPPVAPAVDDERPGTLPAGLRAWRAEVSRAEASRARYVAD